MRLETYTHVCETLRSYVCFFNFSGFLQEAKLVTWNWAGCQYKVVLREVFLSMLCLWLIKGWLVLQSCLIYSFASRKRVSWGYSFTSSNDLFGSSWVTCKYMNTKICVSRLLNCLCSQCRLLLGRFLSPSISDDWSSGYYFPGCRLRNTYCAFCCCSYKYYFVLTMNIIIKNQNPWH